MKKNIEKQRKVVVGVSGGVDSSVAAYILKKEGYNVLALHMKSSNSETAVDDEKRVRQICERIGVALEVVDYKDEMQIVKDYFVSEYKKGKTPNPCVICNKAVKFKPFIDYAKKMDADFFATGHYARIEHVDGKHLLHTAKDENKDQTYFLNQLSNDQLSKVLFPIGELTKQEVRKLAEEIGFDNENVKESYDVCFLGSEKFKDYIDKAIPEKMGDIIDVSSGKVVGKHTGLSKYTLGQRKGLGIGGGFGKTLEPWFVSKKDIVKNILYVEQGNGESLYSDQIIVDEFNWILETKTDVIECFAKFRYRQTMQKVQVKKNGTGVVIILSEKQRSVTPGQFAVLYKEEKNKTLCLGGGEISSLNRDGVKLDI